MLSIETCFSPLLFPARMMQGNHIVVVIDVLRATTAFCAAFDRGFRSILPVATLEEARSYKEKGCVVAAEREGNKLDFADFGNSPVAFLRAEKVAEKLVYSTTNGTRAIETGKQADLLVAASFSNLSAVSRWIENKGKNLLILCSGWKNTFSLEDAMCAGALASRLMANKNFTTSCDATRVAMFLWKNAESGPEGFAKQSSHYQRLLNKGLSDDLNYCFRMDTSGAVPVMADGVLVNAGR